MQPELRRCDLLGVVTNQVPVSLAGFCPDAREREREREREGSETENSEATATLPKALALGRCSQEGLAAISDLLVTLPWMEKLHPLLRFCGSADESLRNSNSHALQILQVLSEVVSASRRCHGGRVLKSKALPREKITAASPKRQVQDACPTNSFQEAQH